MEQKIDQLLREMTLTEKVGQLRQCGPSLVGAFGLSFDELVNMVLDGRIPKEKFDEMMNAANQDYREADLRAGKIGSYNGVADAQIANRLQKIAVEETRLGIPLLFGYDVIHGLRTVTPIPLAESCAWNPGLWEETARMSAAEAAAAGINLTFAPMVDVARDARWGRISESAGEDTYLNAVYGAAKVRGFQGADLREPGTVVSCVKHFAAYGAVEAGRDYNRVDMSLQKLYEEYLPPYRACVNAGVRAVMPAFNDINGVPCTANHWLIDKVLRHDWQFTGMTVSDSNAIAECVNHGHAADRRDAAARALAAGVDIDMASDCYHEHLVRLAEAGALPEDQLNRAVRNVLRVKMELGLFERPYRTDEENEAQTLLQPEFRQLARRAAEESMVLLKNDGMLPLKNTCRIAVVGQLAGMRGEMTGTWAIKANGDDCVSLVDALQAQQLDYGYYTLEEVIQNEDIDQQMADYDIVLAALGERKIESGEAASKADLSLPENQLAALKKLRQTAKPIVAVLFNGRPLAIPWLKENAAAILEAWHPGVEAGHAIVNILSGQCNPSGKLTASFPQHSGQCPLYYDHINTGRPAGKSRFTSKYLDVPDEPVYPFGYGLSYTDYQYEGLSVTGQGEEVHIAVSVTNTGRRDGTEIVQCYFRDLVAQRVRPVKKLVAFERIFIKSGETKEVGMTIPIEALGYYDPAMNYVVEAGAYEFLVGGDSENTLGCEWWLGAKTVDFLDASLAAR